MHNNFIFIFLLLLSNLFNSIGNAAGNEYNKQPLTKRVDRLERLLNAQKQLELLSRLQYLQLENQHLRALLEEQNNDFQLFKQQQRKDFADLNRRLNHIEGGDAAASVNSHVKIADVPLVEIDVLPERETKAPAMTIKPISGTESQAEQKNYQAAYNELRSRHYSKAGKLFLNLIQLYPHGHYAHLAQYWIAEAAYAQHHYKQAIIDYQKLLDIYPGSPKKAEAELKKAYSYYELGNKDKARKILNQLLINYPKTTEAGQAKRLLKKI